ncbi:HNH endonuclease [Kitasatospora sp. NPDC056800]|uniref:HNH endonuclease n=1 Tax=Kitasatospora sp. NPDC056800 TaxID=3345948 RepID=UPI0036B836A9
MCRRCFRLHNLGSAYCVKCAPIMARPSKGRAYKTKDRHSRGYDNEWLTNVKAAIAKRPYCLWCMTKGDKDNPLTGDHIIPVSRGGTNEPRNIRVLCRRCNSRRGNRTNAKGPLAGPPVRP